MRVSWSFDECGRFGILGEFVERGNTKGLREVDLMVCEIYVVSKV